MVLYNITGQTPWVNTAHGRIDSLVTMTLMQMISDAYEEAEEVWQNEMKSDIFIDGTETAGPNEAQRAVRRWLTYAKFLPPPPTRTKSDSKVQSLDETEHASPTPKSTPKWRQYVSPLSLPKKPKRSKTMNEQCSSGASSSSLLSFSPVKTWAAVRGRSRSLDSPSFPTTIRSGVRSLPSTPSKSRTLPSSSLGPTAAVPKVINFRPRPRFPTDIPRRNSEPSPTVPSFDKRALNRLKSPQPISGSREGVGEHLYAPSIFFKPELESRYVKNLIHPASLPWPVKPPTNPISPQEGPIPAPNEGLADPEEPVTLWTLFCITMLGYFLFFAFFVVCLCCGVGKLCDRFACDRNERLE